MDFVRIHAGHIKALHFARSVQQSVIPGTGFTKAEVIADQYITRPEAAHQYFGDEVLGRQPRQSRVERQHHGLVNPALGQITQFVAQRAHPGWCQIGFLVHFGEIVAWMRFKGQRYAGHATLLGFALE